MQSKFIYRSISAVLTASLVLSGCAVKNDTKAKESVAEPAVTTEDTVQTELTEEPVSTTVEEIPFEFNPHVYNAMLSATYGDEYRDAFFNLCDALRAGEDTFECASKEAYDWCMNELTLSELFPVACMTVTDKSTDGSLNYENGTGRIYYTIPVEEFVQRQSEFEEEITEILNTYVKSSYTDFEKCLALYDYMVSEYVYDYNDEWMGTGVGASYFCFKEKRGLCSSLADIYAYLLMQVGVDAIHVSHFGEGNAHAWTFVTVNGKGYHIDPTWGLKIDYSSKKFYLDCFMMTDNDRANSGYPAEGLSVPLLPYNYANQCTEYSYVADDDSYRFPPYTACTGYDTDNNIIWYSLSGNDPIEFYYE